MFLILKHTVEEQRVNTGNDDGWGDDTVDDTVVMPVGVTESLSEAQTALVILANKNQTDPDYQYGEPRKTWFEIVETPVADASSVFQINVDGVVSKDTDFAAWLSSEDVGGSLRAVGVSPSLGSYECPKVALYNEVKALDITIGKPRKDGSRHAKISVAADSVHGVRKAARDAATTVNNVFKLEDGKDTAALWKSSQELPGNKT